MGSVAVAVDNVINQTDHLLEKEYDVKIVRLSTLLTLLYFENKSSYRPIECSLSDQTPNLTDCFDYIECCFLLVIVLGRLHCYDSGGANFISGLNNCY